ncbi:MAG: DUF302 domain-containing protein [Archangium sp.]|nr:DUF302 domain-containing protein [Archangium sp.]
MEIGMKKMTGLSFEQALERVPELLKTEGFGVLTRIDVKDTLKQKIDVDFRRYTILGACNPKLAHQALGQELGFGVLMPCNVVVWEGDDGKAVVTAVDPMQTVAAGAQTMRPLVEEIRTRLSRVIAQV